MNKSQATFPPATPFWPVLFWPVLLLVGLASARLRLGSVLGYRWSVELSLALLLLICAIFCLLHRPRLVLKNLTSSELGWIQLPFGLFVLWSFLSATWSASWTGALHHSLLWSCYLSFYFIIRHSILDDQSKGAMLKMLGAILFTISLACVVEYVARDSPMSKVFNERYYPYAEVFVTFLPILVACSLRAEKKWSNLALLVSVLCWAAVLVTTSRAMLIAGVVGLAAFALLIRLARQENAGRKRLIVTFFPLVIITIISFFPLRSQDTTTVKRFAVSDEFGVQSAQSRFLLWGLAVEGFRNQPVTGIGADNYFVAYKELRKSLAARYPDSTILETGEELIPERSHNEYLQILAELGIIGAILFSWLLVGILYLFVLAIRKRASLMTIGALSGMAAFLVASGVSSYSLRLPANGICFFFLLAMASRDLLGATEETEEKTHHINTLLAIVGVIISLSMIGFCLVRANSIRHMTNAVSAKDKAVKIAEIDAAISIDPSEPMFRFYKGQWLQQSRDYAGAIHEMRIAIDNGLANSTSFFRLAETQAAARMTGDAESTYAEALRVYPRSVFLRTAYSAFLKRNGESARAKAEYQSALSVNERQARSWQVAHDEGLERLVQIAHRDANYASTFELKPDSGALALDAFQGKSEKDLP